MKGIRLMVFISLWPLLGFGQQFECFSIADLKSELSRNYGTPSRYPAIYMKLGDAFLNSQSPKETRIDSANYYYQKVYQIGQKTKNDSLLAWSLTGLGKVTHYSNKEDAGNKMFNQALEIYAQSGNRMAQADTWRLKGESLQLSFIGNQSYYGDILNCYNEAQKIYKSLGAKAQLAYNLKNIADIHLNQGKLNLAVEELEETIALYKSINYPFLHYTYDLLSVCHRLLGNPDKSLFYAQSCVESAEATQDHCSIFHFYHVLADIYRDIGQAEKSLALYVKSYETWKQEKTKIAYPTFKTISRICEILIELGRPEEALETLHEYEKSDPINSLERTYKILQTKAAIHIALKEYKKAEFYVKQLGMVDSLKEHDYLAEYSSVVRDLGKFYYETKNYEKAQFYLQKSLDVPHGILSIPHQMQAYLLLFQTDSATQDFNNATRNLRRYMSLKDSMYSLEKTEKLEELQIQYDLATKERDLYLLQNQNFAQEAKLTQTRLFKNIVLIASICLFALLILLLYSYRAKQRSNRYLISQKSEIDQKNISLEKLLDEKEWLIKEIHHRVKNNLQVVTSLLNTQVDYLNNEEALASINKSKHRIQAISLIHQKLYDTRQMNTIEMDAYIKELVGYLKDSFDTGNKVTIDLDLDSILLNESQAIPLGLILNEAITNSYKYGFENPSKGRIKIAFKILKNQYFRLKISDNGKGVPKQFDLDKSESMGLKLIRGLSDQLEGSLKIATEDGFCIELVFQREQNGASEPKDFL